MQYRRLGQGPLTVSEISYGTWLTVGGGVERTQAIACVHAALDQGITLFDTANQYGAGGAERTLGEAVVAQLERTEDAGGNDEGSERERPALQRPGLPTQERAAGQREHGR